MFYFDNNFNLFCIDGDSFCFEWKTKMADFKFSKFPEQKFVKIFRFWRKKHRIFGRNIRFVYPEDEQVIKSQIQRLSIFTLQQTFVTEILKKIIQWRGQWWWFWRIEYQLEFGDNTWSSRTLWPSRRCKSQGNSRPFSTFLVPLLLNSRFLFEAHQHLRNAIQQIGSKTLNVENQSVWTSYQTQIIPLTRPWNHSDCPKSKIHCQNPWRIGTHENFSFQGFSKHMILQCFKIAKISALNVEWVNCN